MARIRMTRGENEVSSLYVLLATVYMLAFLNAAAPSRAGKVGINYGRVANDLPTPLDVAHFVQSQGIGSVKIFDADSTVIKAFANTQIQLTIGVPNEQLQSIATDPTYADSWVMQNVSAFYPATQIVAIAVGNEVLTSSAYAQGVNLVPAMTNLHASLLKHNLSAVKLSSPHSMGVLQSSYPPSGGVFNATYASSILTPYFDFILATNSVVMVNVYPFFAYSSNPAEVPLSYALFTPSQLVTDPTTGLQYKNLFDAQLDAFFSAMKALNGSYMNLTVAVTETGWPSMGDSGELGADVQNAQSYNGNLVKSVLSGAGTPLRPNVSMDAFVFALFNENQKTGPTSERNYGMFYPNLTPVYSLNFTTGETSAGNATEVGAPTVSSPTGAPTGAPTVQPPTASSPTTQPYVSSPLSAPAGALSFCVAKADANPEALQAALDYACGQGGADCAPLQPGSPCFDPNTLTAHASYAFNSYYQNNARSPDACFFGGNAVMDTTSPSTGDCTYPTG